MKGDMCLWRGKVMVFDSNWWEGTLRKRVENHEKRNLCFEGEYVHMKGKSDGFWPKLIGGAVRKRLENHDKRDLWF